jgi:hypothetical protein
MAMLDESKDTIGQVNVAPGINGSEADAVMADFQKTRGSFGNMAKSAMMGAGMGAQAAQGAMNPLTAFIQGAAAGLQAPAMVFKQKQDQIQSALDASPLAATHSDLAQAYPTLAGMPTKLAIQTIQQIAIDTHKIAKETEGAISIERKKKELEKLFPKIDYKSEQDMATDFNKLPEVTEYKAVKSAHNQIATAQLKIWDDKAKTYLPNPAGQLAVVSGYIKLLNPQARFTEGTLSAADVGSDVDKYTIDLYNRLKTGNVAGEDEVKRIQGAARAKYKEVTRNYRKVADIWGDKADARGLDSNFVLSGDTGSGESIDDVFKTIAAQHPGMTKQEIFAIMKSQGY